jgi:hypothetical protein
MISTPKKSKGGLFGFLGKSREEVDTNKKELAGLTNRLNALET